jgi:ABC-type antimicrobial peptide transport system permease subunit
MDRKVESIFPMVGKRKRHMIWRKVYPESEMSLYDYILIKGLSNYEYHTDLSWWIFAGAGASALAITILTVSFQAIKAALMNPVRSLRSE